MSKTEISVLGLLPAQAHTIKNMFKSRAKLKFWDGGDPPDSLKAIAKNSDAIFMRTKHASHNTFEVLKRWGANPTLVNGGLNQLQAAIEGYLNGNTK